ncbi:MAG: acyl carrier protein [Pseudomonadota bacterium]
MQQPPSVDTAITATNIIALLQRIAPELQPDQLDPEHALRQQVDLDSMDWLNFIISLHRTFAIAIPERDYRELTSIQAIIDYIERRRAEGA